MSEQIFRFIVLTGPPGCGKTTLVKKVSDLLREKNYTLDGFYTEEVRSGRERVGFDVVLLSGERSPLARIRSGTCQRPFVGKYVVEVNSFETCVLPVLNAENENSILVLDEIGKMELLSQKFKEFVSKFINNGRGMILATVPLKGTIPLVDMIKTHPNTCLITVDKGNRNALIDKVTDLIISAKEKTPSLQT